VKIYLTILILLLSFPCLCFSALDEATVWETRTTGNDGNGGGFNPDNASAGTDRTEADAAFDSGTDLASADGDAVPCVVTSATHNFVAADYGNIIQITEEGDGFTLGYYEIVSADANAATLDRACGSDGAKTGGDWAFGGASLTIQESADAGVRGNTHYVEAGTYEEEVTLGANNEYSFFIGYNESRDDTPIGSDRPKIDCDGIGDDCLDANLATKSQWRHWWIYGADDYGISSDYGPFLYNVRVSNCTNDGYRNGQGPFFFCEFDNNTNNGSDGDNYRKAVGFYSYAHDNGGEGFGYNKYNYDAVYSFCLAEGNSGDGFNVGRFKCSYNVAYNNTGAGVDGFQMRNNGDTRIIGCAAVDNGAYGYNRGSDGTPFVGVNWGCEGNGTACQLGLDDGGNLSGHAASLNINNVTDDPLMGAGGIIQSGSAYIDAALDLSDYVVGHSTSFEWNIGLDQDDYDAGGGGGGASSFTFVQ